MPGGPRPTALPRPRLPARVRRLTKLLPEAEYLRPAPAMATAVAPPVADRSPPAPPNPLVALLATIFPGARGLQGPATGASAIELEASLLGPDFLGLIQRGIDLIQADRAPSTARVYDSHFARFAAFCASFAQPALPADHKMVFAYLIPLAGTGVLYGSISTACAAIAFRHRCALQPASPTDHPVVVSLRQALRRALSAAVKRRETLPLATVIQLAEQFGHPDTCLISRMLTTYMVCSVAGLFRFSDWRGVTPAHIRFAPTNDHVEITVPHRKNDQYCQGHMVLLAAGSSAACPVALLRRYVADLAEHDAALGWGPRHPQLPLFRRFDGNLFRLGSHRDAPHAPLSDAPLDYDRAHHYTIQFLSEVLGLAPTETAARFGTHSFRRSGASALAAHGASTEDIRQAGGWRSIDSPLAYVETSVERRGRIVRLLGL